MENLANIFLTIGVLLLLGVITDYIGQRTRLPRVTLLLVFGVLIGPAGLSLLPDMSRQWFPFIAHIALVMVGFLLGEKLTLKRLREHGHSVITISLSVVLMTALLVFFGLWFLGYGIDVALLLAAIATATAPAATADVVQEIRAKGKFTDTLLGIVAIDDAWGLILFSLVLAGIQTFLINSSGSEVLFAGLWEIIGALVLGIVLGAPMSYLSGRICPGEPIALEALVVVFICAGMSLWLNVSYLLAAVMMGAVVANLAKHHTRPFHEIENIERPFMILFFVLAGASLEIASIKIIGILSIAYILLRIAGRIVGAELACRAFRIKNRSGRLIGLALMPQAGVAMGMALAASHRLPQLSSTILSVVVATTVIFELIGPIMTRYALMKSGEGGLFTKT